MSGDTTVAGKSVLVTGANRGLGRALVEEALRRGASGLLDLEGGGVLADAIAARPPGRTVRERSCRHARPDRHGHGPRSPDPRSPPDSVPRGIFDGMENDDEEIFPDPISEMMAESWRTGAAKELERRNAALVQPQPLAA